MIIKNLINLFYKQLLQINYKMKIIYFLLFYFTYGLSNNIKSNEIVRKDNIFIRDWPELNGYDMRYPIVENDDNNLYELIRKSDLLSFLKNKSISTNRKLDLIQDNDILNNNLMFDLLAGGLMDDYEFEID